MNISQTKLLKPLSEHEYTHQMQTYCERKKIHGTVPLMNILPLWHLDEQQMNSEEYL